MPQDKFATFNSKEETNKEYIKCLKNSAPEPTFQTHRLLAARFRNKNKRSTNMTDKTPQRTKKPLWRKQKPPYPFEVANKCKRYLSKYCGQYFDGRREFSCFKNTYLIDYNTTLTNNHIFYQHPKRSVADMLGKPMQRDFDKHNECMRRAKLESTKCIAKLRSPCKNASVRGAKVIRMRMRTVRALLARDPSIKIIHYFRDPRGLELSRSVGMTGNKDKAMIADSVVTCRKMKQDILERKLLEQMYPQSFKVLRYEDLAMSAFDTTNEVYDFIGSTMPPEVYAWLKTNTHNPNAPMHNNLSTSRKNSTETALRWRSKMNESTIADIAAQCEFVLNELGYDV